MKSVKIIMLSFATLVAIGVTSCAREKSVTDNRIDVDKLKTELTKAVGQSINESTQVSKIHEKNVGNDDNVTIVKDSASTATQSPVINVYVDIPSENAADIFENSDFIPALAIIMVFAVPCITFLLIIIAILVFVYKRNRNRNAVIQQAIESGYQLPEAFYNSHSHSDKRRNPQLLQAGIRNIGVGVLLCISFSIFFSLPVVGVLCLIPAVIGAGKLVTYYSSEKDNSISVRDISND